MIFNVSFAVEQYCGNSHVVWLDAEPFACLLKRSTAVDATDLATGIIRNGSCVSAEMRWIPKIAGGLLTCQHVISIHYVFVRHHIRVVKHQTNHLESKWEDSDQYHASGIVTRRLFNEGFVTSSAKTVTDKAAKKGAQFWKLGQVQKSRPLFFPLFTRE